MRAPKTMAKSDAEGFSFNDTSLKSVAQIMKRYPSDRKASAVMPLLDLAQRQNGGWLSEEAIRYVAAFLEIPEIRAWEVATFYSMYHLCPVGKYVVNVCTTTPCWLQGSDKIMRACEKWLGIKKGETTSDKMFSLREVECLGACVNAPVMAIDDQYFEDLDEESVAHILQVFAEGGIPTSGPQNGRKASEPLKRAAVHTPQKIKEDAGQKR